MQGTPNRLSRSTTALLTTMLAVSGLPSLSASGSNNPEISDATGDTNPAAFFNDTPSNHGAFENITAYDLEKVYVLVETSTDLLLQFQVRDLPDRWGFPLQLAEDEGLNETLGPNASQPSVVLAANFTVRGVGYEVAANLSQPTGQGLRDTYTITRRGTASVPISGSYDVSADTITLAVRKQLLGSPRYGDVLSQFRAEGRFGAAKLDFAPDAVNYEAGVQPDPGIVAIILQKLTGQQVVQPRYGANYTFNYRAGGAGDIQLTSAQTERTIGPGGTAIYSFDVKNRGSASDTVFFTLSDPDVGYHHRLSKTEVFLSPGETKNVQVTVSTAPAARGSAISIVEAQSRLGATDSLIFETSIVEGAPTSTTGQSNPVEATDPPGEDPSSAAPFSPTRKRTKAVPGFEAILLGLAAAAVLAFVRRRA